MPYNAVDPATNTALQCLTIARSDLYGPYFNVMSTPPKPTSYLSCTTDGEVVDLWNEDDKSGRQRWEILPNGVSVAGLVLCYIRVLCGVTGDRQYFAVDTDRDPAFPNGRIHLVQKDLADSFVICQNDADTTKFAFRWYNPIGTIFYVAPGSNSQQIGLSTDPVAFPWAIKRVVR